MKPGLRILLVLAVFFLFLPKSRAASFKLDSLYLGKALHLAEQFHNHASLSDIHGHFHPDAEEKFARLFTENATIYNFIPGSRYYRRTTNPMQYKEGVREVLKTQRILPVQVNINVDRIRPMADGQQFIVYLRIKQEIATALKDFSGFSEFWVDQLVSVWVDITTETALIFGTQLHDPEFVDLEFRALLPNQRPASGIEITFSYRLPENGSMVTRYRETGEGGMFQIGGLPASSEIRFHPPNRYRLLNRRNIQDRAWSDNRQQDRVLQLRRRPILARGATLHLGTSLTGMADPLLMYTTGELPLNRTNTFQNFHQRFSFHYLVNLISSTRHELKIGSGLEQMLGAFDSRMDDQTQVFMGFADDHKKHYNLYIKAEDIHEEYEYESVAIPLILSYHYLVNGSFLYAIEISGRLQYILSEKLNYRFSVGEMRQYRLYSSNQGTRTGTRPPAIARETDISDSHSGSGIIDQDAPLGGTLRFSALIPIAGRLLFLQPFLEYQAMRMGHPRSGFADPGSQSGDIFSYSPALSYRGTVKIAPGGGFALVLKL